MRVGSLLLALGLLQGCGYAPMTGLGVVPSAIEVLYVEIEEGPRGDPELADALERDLRRVVRRDGRFRLASEPAQADAILRVDIDSSVTRLVAFDQFDDPLDYETTVSVAVRLQQPDGHVMWKAANVAATRAHAAVAGAVVTSSSAFVSSERLRPEDLAAFDTVQLGEQRLSHSRAALAGDLASAIYSRMMGGR